MFLTVNFTKKKKKYLGEININLSQTLLKHEREGNTTKLIL